MSAHTLDLATGDKLPSVGLGLWKIDKSLTADVVINAAEIGYRHFDCACDYGNEVEVGNGLQRVLQAGAVCRDDLWITSKLWNTYHRAEHVRPATEQTLRDLQLDYLDLYLIHFPISLRFVPFEDRYPPEWFFDPSAESPRLELDPVPIQDTWRAMEGLVRDGLVKNIGVCNFGTSLLRDLLSYAEIRPAVLQVESHPYLTQDKLLRFCREENIAVTAFSPLGAQSYFSLNMAQESESVLEQEAIKEIAAHHGRTPAQVVLRWGVQRGTAIVPKSSRPERLRENIALFDFELGNDEMTAISALNRNRRFNDPGDFCEAAFNTFMPIYE
ncbi:MAG: aldo/keto reductase [Planctomycetaceae bacterium]|nr:aldo/keto reductase [Planctomycetales bacterium]MCB9921973.1 aldo/keto reductase [Planctomycetaceae bacterium]